MPALILTGMGQTSPLAAFSQEMAEELKDLSPFLKEVAEEIILPAFGRHYDQSGIKSHSQVYGPGGNLLKTAVTKAQSFGNVLEIRPRGLTAGVSYEALPYAKWVFEGRGAVLAKKAKALRFYDDSGKPIFVKRVGPAPPHPVIFLTEGEFTQIADRLTQKLVEMGAHPIGK